MTRHNRKLLERRLRHDRDEARRALAGTVPDFEPDRSTTDRADLASIAIERELDEMLAAREADVVAEIDETLARLARDPKFGRCSVCDARIPARRLAVLPTTRFCAKHAPAG